MADVKNFNDLSKSDVTIAGGKGASLGEMTQAGIPVPPGFVVLTSAFDNFIEETGLKIEIDAVLDTVDHQEIHTGEFASEKIRALILNQEIPSSTAQEITAHFEELGAEYVAVRSSASAEDGADAAWAGQLESYLNTTKEDLLEKVKLCWSSLFTPRAIFYRFKQGFQDQHISVAVVVQKMVASEISGIGFSVHPVTEDRNQLIIEAGFGLGEAIVSGSITPDNYVVEKDKWEILDSYISEQTQGLFRIDGGGNEWQDVGEKGGQQKLSNEKVIELAKLIVKIEDHYGFPVDTEWAYEDGHFYIVQSRPITTLQQTMPNKDWNSPELANFNQADWRFHGHWKQDLFPAYFWHSCYDKAAIEKIGLPISEIGYLIFKEGHYLASQKVYDQILETVRKSLANGDLSVWERLKEEAKNSHGEILEYISKVSGPLTAQNWEEVIELSKINTLYWGIAAAYLCPIADQMLQEAVIKEGLDLAILPKIIPELDTPMASQRRELLGLKEQFVNKKLPFESSSLENDLSLSEKFQKHLGNYAWVQSGSWTNSPLTPESLLELISLAEAEPHKNDTSQFSPSLKTALGLFEIAGYLRQACGEYTMQLSFALHARLEDYVEKLGISYSDLLKLSPTELLGSLKGEVTKEDIGKITKRRASGNWITFTDKENKEVIIEDEHDVARMVDLMVPKPDNRATVLNGQVGNPGKATGAVKVVMNAADFNKIQPGDILVSTMTTPDFVVLMHKASAIVTDQGGLLCHAAIVSREINKPCVIGTKFATQVLHDGQTVEVDAHNGTVRIIETTGISEWNTPALAGFKPEEYEFHGLWKCTILTDYFWSVVFNADLAKKTDLSLTETGSFTLNVGNYLSKKSIRSSLHDRIMRALKEKDLDFFENLKTTIDTEFKETKDVIDSVSKKELNGDNIRHAFEALRRLAFLESTGYLLTYSFEPELLTWAKEHGINDQDIANYIPAIETPLLLRQQELTTLREELQKDSALDLPDDQLLQKIKADDEISKKFDDHLQKFGWIEILGFGGEKLTPQRLIAILRDFEPTMHIHKELKELSEESETFLKAASYLSYVREIGAEYFSMCSLAIRPLLEGAAAKLGVTYTQLIDLLPEEIASYVDNHNESELKELLAKRATGLWALFEKDGLPCVVDDPEDIQKLIKALLPQSSDTDELHGQVGFPGIVEGRARIIMNSSEFGKMQKGEILVTTMTTPDFVTLMQTASAIVTDTGGLLSHAAIVSRELQKPCVIGTKFATKTFKDGDLIQVDANVGVVRKIDEEKIIFEKAYTRDTTIILQQAWNELIKHPVYASEENPYSPATIHYMNDGVIEVWENKKANKWILDKAQELMASDEAKMMKLIDKYEEDLAEIKAYWENGPITDIAQFEKYLDRMYEVMKEFDCMYVPSYDERTPAKIRERTLKLRNEDTYFESNDKLIRASIAAIYPQLKGYETTVLRSEIKNPPAVETLKERKKNFVIIGEEYAEATSLENYGANNPNYQFESEEPTIDDSTLRGQVGNKGFARGFVRVIKRKEQIPEVQEGEIIVSPMTTPDFMPAMQKAAAFVTDEGGVTCHAAIVARELNKPCVIGTKFATQVLKDGDEVDVDANTGVIKIIG